MMKRICALLMILSLYSANAQESKTVEGPMKSMSAGEIIQFQSVASDVPEVGQLVSISRSMETKDLGLNFKGTLGIANGKYLGRVGNLLKVQVTEWTSTIMIDGKNTAKPKNGQTIIIKWAAKIGFKNQALSLFKKSKYDEAILMLDSAIIENSNDDYLYFLRGVCHYRNYDHRDAAVDLTVYLKEKPNDQDALLYRAFSYGRFWKYKEAIADIGNVDLEKQSDKIKEMTYKKMADWYVSLKEFTLACETVEKLSPFVSASKFSHNFKQHYCVSEKIAEDKTYHITTEIIVKNDEMIEVTAIDDLSDCYLGGTEVNKPKTLKVGQLVSMSRCSSNSLMPEAVMMVKSVKGKKITLEVWYWTIHMNNEPSEVNFKIGDNWSFAW
jgi:hypothetical protein